MRIKLGTTKGFPCISSNRHRGYGSGGGSGRETGFPLVHETADEHGSPSAVPVNPNSRLVRPARPHLQGRVMERIFVGIDVAKDRLDVHVRPSAKAWRNWRSGWARSMWRWWCSRRPAASRPRRRQRCARRACRSRWSTRARSATSPGRPASSPRPTPSTPRRSPTSPRRSAPSPGRCPARRPARSPNWSPEGARSSR